MFVVVIFDLVVLMTVFMVAAGRMIVVLLFLGMAVYEAMGVVVDVVVQVFMLDLFMPVRVRVQVMMQVAVLVLMLELADSRAVALAVHVR